MPLPQDVRASIERANEITASMQGTPPQPGEGAPNESDTLTQGDDQTPQPAPAPAPEAALEGAASVVVDRRSGEQGDAEYWLQRFKTMAGMNAKLQRDMTEQATQFAAQLEALSQQVAALQKPSEPAPKVSDDEEVFGKDLVDMARRIAAEQINQAVGQAIAPLQQRNQELERQLQAVHGQTQVLAEGDFFARLDEARPDWEAINARPDWLRWLGEQDPLSGLVRQQMLDQAIGSKNVARTVALFEAFAGKHNPAPTAPPVSPAPRTVGSQAAPAQRLDDSGPLVTREEIAKYYRDLASGAYRTKPDEKKRMDELIAQAVKTGRIGG